MSTWAECSESGDNPDGAEDTLGERDASGAGGAGVTGGASGVGGAGGAADALDGEWCAFWANYNNSLGSVPLQGYYDRCPTPYRTDTVDLADWGMYPHSTTSTTSLDDLSKHFINKSEFKTPQASNHQSSILC